MFWKECRQAATEEKQIDMIDIQAATQAKVNEINNKKAITNAQPLSTSCRGPFKDNLVLLALCDKGIEKLE